MKRILDRVCGVRKRPRLGSSSSWGRGQAFSSSTNRCRRAGSWASPWVTVVKEERLIRIISAHALSAGQGDGVGIEAVTRSDFFPLGVSHDEGVGRAKTNQSGRLFLMRR